MRRWLGPARVGWLVALAAAAGWLAWGRREELGLLVAGARPGFLVAALAVGGVQLAVNAAFWRSALAALGEPVAHRAVLGVSARSLLARYIPGSVWYAVGRGVLLNKRGVGKRALAATAGLEAALSVATGLALGVALLLAVDRLPGGLAGLAVWCALAAAAVSPPAVNLGLRLLARRHGGQAQRISWPRFVVLLGWMVAFWLGAAGMFVLYLHAFPQVTVATVEAAGAFMVAWVVGFFAVFAPQGLGVFEVAVATILAGEPFAALALVVAAYRGLTLVRDLLAVGIAELTARRW